MTILDHIAASHARFRPKTPDEFLGLRIAQRLGDERVAAEYAATASQASPDALVVAYIRARKHALPGEDAARRFQSELKTVNGHSHVESPTKLVALKIERRTVAAAVFAGTRLDFVQTQELSSVATKAEASTVGFLNWLYQAIQAGSAAVEAETSSEVRRGTLRAVAVHCLREQGVAIREVDKQDVIAAFGTPPPTTRRELREIVNSIWPILEPDRPAILDAVALGLYVQTERLLG